MRTPFILEVPLGVIAAILFASCEQADTPPEGTRAPGDVRQESGFNTINFSELVSHDTGTCTYAGELFTGRAVERAEGESLRKEHYFVDGYRHGIVREWHENGALKFEKKYKNGLAEGLALEWDEEGNLEQVRYRGGTEIDRIKGSNPKESRN